MLLLLTIEAASYDLIKYLHGRYVHRKSWASRPSKIYTVAIWQGTVHEEYITEVLESYEGTFEELLTAKLKADQIISPAKDDRMELKWD